MKLKIMIVERENETVWGEKEKERETIVSIDGMAETYSLRFIEYLAKDSKWKNRSIGYSVGDITEKAKGKVILSKCLDMEVDKK